MLFDQLCGFVEKRMPSIEDVLRRAKLFWWPGKPEDLPKSWSDEEIAFLRENFFLPFSTIAVEDSVSCIVLDDIETEQRGLETRRRFIEYLDINEQMVRDSREADETPESKEKWYEMVRRMRKEHGEVRVVTLGKARMLNTTGTGRNIEGEINVCIYMMGRDEVMHISPRDPIWRMLQTSALRNFATAIEEVTTFNTPNRFVVETSPALMKRGTHSPKIPRSHDRPQYTLLTKGEVQKILHVETDDANDRQHPSAHWRRRHFRTFHSDRFVGAKGKTIVIPACWVGPTEKIVGSKRYKVRIDL